MMMIMATLFMLLLEEVKDSDDGEENAENEHDGVDELTHNESILVGLHDIIPFQTVLKPVGVFHFRTQLPTNPNYSL